MKIAFGLLVIGVIAGCATQRPQMPLSYYEGFAGKWLVTDYCNWKGWMSPDVAARGHLYINSDISTWTYDASLLKNTMEDLRGRTQDLNQGDCRRMAASIEERKQKIDIHNTAVAQEERAAQNTLNATRPTQTYCNRIGNQVFCNSF